MPTDDGSTRERHPDVVGIDPIDPLAIAKKVRGRRVRRRLKAAGSLLLAAAAGTFLACVRKGDNDRPVPAPNPTTGELSNLPAPIRAQTAAEMADGGADTGRAGADPSRGGARAGTGDGSPQVQRDAAIDREEHRKGMPVPDNLLE